MAEREQLGSNLLRVDLRTPEYPRALLVRYPAVRALQLGAQGADLDNFDKLSLDALPARVAR